MRVYLDVDGVVLYHPVVDGKPTSHPHTRPGWNGQGLTLGAEAFFRVSLAHDCYWLSVWGQHGKRSRLEDLLLPFLPYAARRFKVARWEEEKTEALDPFGEWIWFDDEAGEAAFLDRYVGNRLELSEAGWRFVKLDIWCPRYFVRVVPGPVTLEVAADVLLLASGLNADLDCDRNSQVRVNRGRSEETRNGIDGAGS